MNYFDEIQRKIAVAPDKKQAQRFLQELRDHAEDSGDPQNLGNPHELITSYNIYMQERSRPLFYFNLIKYAIYIVPTLYLGNFLASVFPRAFYTNIGNSYGLSLSTRIFQMLSVVLIACAIAAGLYAFYYAIVYKNALPRLVSRTSPRKAWIVAILCVIVVPPVFSLSPFYSLFSVAFDNFWSEQSRSGIIQSAYEMTILLMPQFIALIAGLVAAYNLKRGRIAEKPAVEKTPTSAGYLRLLLAAVLISLLTIAKIAAAKGITPNTLPDAFGFINAMISLAFAIFTNIGSEEYIISRIYIVGAGIILALLVLVIQSGIHVLQAAKERSWKRMPWLTMAATIYAFIFVFFPITSLPTDPHFNLPARHISKEIEQKQLTVFYKIYKIASSTLDTGGFMYKVTQTEDKTIIAQSTGEEFTLSNKTIHGPIKKTGSHQSGYQDEALRFSKEFTCASQFEALDQVTKNDPFATPCTKLTYQEDGQGAPRVIFEDEQTPLPVSNLEVAESKASIAIHVKYDVYGAEELYLIDLK